MRRFTGPMRLLGAHSLCLINEPSPQGPCKVYVVVHGGKRWGGWRNRAQAKFFIDLNDLADARIDTVDIDADGLVVGERRP